MLRIVTLSLLLLYILTISAVCQSTPSSDPQAVSYANQALSAMVGSATITDVTLSGTATWIAGSDTETGTATLYAKGTAESRMDLSLTGGNRTEIRNSTGTWPQGQSIAVDGSYQTWAMHNCWTSPSWFFPVLSGLASTTDPNLVFTYVGQEALNGADVQHLQIYRYAAGRSASWISLTQQLSTMDIYLDSTSLLPVSFVLNGHPDNDAMTNIGLEIDFSSYQNVNGVLIPMHVQKLIWNGLAVDLSISSVSFNTGLPESLFTVTQ